MGRRVGGVIVVIIVVVCGGLLTLWVRQVQQAAALSECVNNLKQICLSIHSYHDVFRRFPNAVVTLGLLENVPFEKRLSWQFEMTATFMESRMGEAPRWPAKDRPGMIRRTAGSSRRS